ncbi:glycoside hydrolase [Cyanosarcina cf. burmensis CCALA 770]|nr:glycoside hydrolase [Cyanosarcina cf. burmensis CCALA 770]
MKVVLSTVGKFHIFDLARQLEQLGVFESIFTGYPQFKLKDEGLPKHKIHSFPWLYTLFALRKKLGLNHPWASHELEWWTKKTFDTYVSTNLPDCDVFLGLSGSALKAGKVAKSRGIGYVCDRGSSHIRYQDTILREEYAKQGKTFEGIEPRIIAQEEAEYELADIITVPSNFVKRSFIEMGIPEKKLRLVPYGVDLKRFHPVEQPNQEVFDVLFVGAASFRKGIPYLLQAFSQLQHPHKRLTLVGTIVPDIASTISQSASEQNIVTKGHIPQSQLKEIMSRSRVLVLPSVEDGFGMVLAQAMACGCPVIGTTHTGAEDLLTDGVEGFIVASGNPEAIAERLQLLADRPDLQQRMSTASLARVKKLGGWNSYGTSMYNILSHLK